MGACGFIPVMGIVGLRKPDLLKRLLASIDYPVEKLVLIDNGGISAQLKEESGLYGQEMGAGASVALPKAF